MLARWQTVCLLAIAVTLSVRVAQGQACSGVPTGTHIRLVTGLAVDGHAYGTTRGALVSGRPVRRLNAWITTGVARTSDADLRLVGDGAVLRGELGVPLPWGLLLCPVGSVGYLRTRTASAVSNEEWSQLDSDWGAAVGWTRSLRRDVRLAVSVRGRRGETRLRRTIRGVGGEDSVDWPYQMLEAFAGVTLREDLVVRPSISYFRYQSATLLYGPQPLARADGEVGFGLLLGFAF